MATQANAGAAVFTVASGITWKPMSGLLAGMTHGNGLVTAAGYDLDYRITSLLVQDGATLVSSLSYGYGDGINLTAVNDNVAGANSVSLGYTPANRLGSASGPWGSASYTYDAVGNRLNHVVTSGSTTTRVASYGATTNRLTGMTENAASLRAYTYDNNGNILTDTRPGEVFAFTYNKRNRPVSVTRNSVAYATYGYNADEQLVSRSTAAAGGPLGTVHYVHDLQGHVIAEANGATGATTREYIWLTPATGLDPVDLPIGLVSSGTLHMIHTDHLARPIRVTDATRATVWQASYTPFGEPQSISGTLALDLRFPGQLFQIETGLAYNWHRHYDPITGRYTQPDPLRFVDGPSIYAYAGSSPFVNVDRDGLEYWPLPGGGGLELPDGSAKGLWDWWWAPPSCPAGDYTPTFPPLASVAPKLPNGLVGVQDGKGGRTKGRHNSGPLAPENGGTGDAQKDFDKLTGGKSGAAPQGSGYPPGTQIGDNGITIRPGPNGPRIDIPSNGTKPTETLHYP